MVYCLTCIDSQPTEAARDKRVQQSMPAKSGTLYHYVIVRDDLPRGVQFAQTIHASGESCEGPLPSGTYAIALAARDEDHLLDLAGRLWDAEVPHTVINEPDAPFNGQAMAIGIWPTRDRERVRRVTSDLSLLGKETRA